MNEPVTYFDIVNFFFSVNSICVRFGKHINSYVQTINHLFLANAEPLRKNRTKTDSTSPTCRLLAELQLKLFHYVPFSTKV